jgi:hypothetical protein
MQMICKGDNCPAQGDELDEGNRILLTFRWIVGGRDSNSCLINLGDKAGEDGVSDAIGGHLVGEEKVTVVPLWNRLSGIEW